VNKGWTNPSYPDSMIKKVLLQFYSTDPSNVNANMQLVAYPGKSYSHVYKDGQTILAIDTVCSPVNISDTTILANNYFNFDALQITQPNGSLKPFSFIRFIPNHEDRKPYISFTIEVVTVVEDKEQVLSTLKTTDPCPPYCPTD
jgi:hypothetical protein